MDPYFYDKLSHFTLGLSFALFITGAINLSRLFKRFNKVPILLFWGLTCLLISSTLTMFCQYWLSRSYPIITVVDCLFYPQAVFISFWLYMKRLQTFYLKSALKIIIKTAAVTTILVVLGDATVFLLQVYGVGDAADDNFYNSYVGFEFIYYLLQELFLFILLMKNVPSLIDLSKSRYRLLLFLTFGILVTSDCINITMYYLQLDINFANMFYLISFFLRLNSVILYYDALKESTVDAATENEEIIETKLGTMSGNSPGYER